MASSASNLSLEERLKLFEYDQQTFSDAINGRSVPLELAAPEMQACLIRGIRHHDGFGTELRGHPPFTRALNARNIMSNAIPTMENPDDFPYCIWYPEVASEETYRKLAKLYPQMRYQVGRACAVAGYVDLYRELELLPEVAIAEEARDNQSNGASNIIFDEIMAAPTRYAVMDDYKRTVNTDCPSQGAFLNADTAVRSSLNWKRRYTEFDSRNKYPHPRTDYSLPDYSWRPFTPENDNETYWNITEDWNFDDHANKEPLWDSENPPTPDQDLRTSLFYSPLPANLPNINKDMLILEAAWSGNIERYTRLRRPTEIRIFEGKCTLHGIHFNTMFAKWWSLQPGILDAVPQHFHPQASRIRAINAKFIMNNNLTRISEDTPDGFLPYLIYWPNVAAEETYAELFRRKPCMKLQIARACIVGDYEDLYKSLDVPGDRWLWYEARGSPNTYYIEDQLKKGGQEAPSEGGLQDWKGHQVSDLMMSWLALSFDKDPKPYHMGRVPMHCWQDGIWETNETDMNDVDAYVCNTNKGLYRES